MGSSYFGEPNMGNERGRGGGGYNNINHPSSSSSSSSSRKGKKNNSDQKPKLPQRGLGVAQLEKIRLHGQISSCAAYHHPSLHPPPHFPPNSTFINIHHDDPRVQIAAYSSSSSSSSSTSYAASYAFHPNVVMGLPEYETTNIRYGDSQPRWEHANAILESQSFAQPNVTRPFLNLYDSQHRSGSSSQNSESSDNQELDLELRLSL